MKKGFILIETIIVSTVLTVSLILVYMTFSNVLSNEKRRVTFNDTGYLYKTYFVEDFINSLEIDTYIKHYFVDDNSAIIRQFSCSDDAYLYKISINDTVNNTTMENPEYRAKKNFCEKLLNNASTITSQSPMNINKVYISKYNLNTVKECTTTKGKLENSSTCNNMAVIKNSLQNVNTNFIYYLRTISSSNSTSYNNVYRLIIEFKESELDYQNIGKKVDGNCTKGYEKINNQCIRRIDKYYYNNVLLVPKGSA